MKNMLLMIAFLCFLTGINLAYGSDASDDTLCFKWPQTECDGGDIYIVVHPIGPFDKQELSKFENILKKVFEKKIDYWNQLSSLKYELYWPGTRSKSAESAFMLSLRVNGLSGEAWESELVLASVLYSHESQKWDFVGPFLMRDLRVNLNSLNTYFDCYIAQNLYRKEFFNLKKSGQIPTYEECEKIFLMEK